jgi:two-component system phosphate regulon response regulator PhoB
MTDKLPPAVLVIENDEVRRTSICNTIERYGFTVYRSNGEENNLGILVYNKPNVAVISSRVNRDFAMDVCRRLRKEKSYENLPAVFIIDKDESPENYSSVDEGLNEYIYRNFTPNELMTSIKSLLRRSNPVFQDKVIKYKDIQMDLATYKVFRGSRRVHLGPTEFKILQLMLQSPKTIFSREQIMEYVWGTEHPIELRTVDVHVNRLRSLLKEKNDVNQVIKTVRASGYCLNLPGEAE